ncbi:MAG: cation-translocating P-type ATPase [Phycisphaerae bacterium]|nr:cation-translocating P-type ATPase [Phycisphaerae bacterium]
MSQTSGAPSRIAESNPDQSWLDPVWQPRVQLVLSLLAGGLLITGVVGGWWTESPVFRAMVWISLVIGMVYGVRAAIDALRNFTVDIDVLMVVGAGLAAAIGHPGEGALLLFLFTLSGALEDLALARTKREIEALHKLLPTEAIVERDGEWIETTPESLVPGDRIKVRPGERIPADAEVDEGKSSIDQSTLTGESLPRSVHPGDTIYAGTVNLDSALTARVLRPASESSLQRVLNLVMEAREQREPMQRLIDRLGQPYAWAVLAISLAIMLVWWIGFREPFSGAAYTAITFLIVLSPCALILATPTATLAAIARGARAGVLFKGGQSIERLSRVGSVCFDKTGTLTFGRASLVQAVPIGWSNADRLLSVAAALESDSTHPIAKAVRDGAIERRIAPAAVSDMLHAAGQGVSGRYDGDDVLVGSYDYVEPAIPACLRSRTLEVLTSVQRDGRIGAVVAAGGDHGAAAVLVIADAIRPGAEGMVSQLHALDVRPVVMLTGDNTVTAEYVARLVGIDRWHADLMPEDKVRLLRELKLERRKTPGRYPGVAFIGDGVNDAPALAAADIAIAIGSIGSDAALESSDIVLLNDDLACVPWAIQLARRARSILRFNITIALAVIVLMGIATLVGSRIGLPVPMSVGVIAHEGGTLFVIVNALRLLWMRGVPPRQSAQPARDAPEPAAATHS